MTTVASTADVMMSDEQIIAGLKSAFDSGCPFLLIYSRRQDIGIQKCERGVDLGYLRFEKHEVDSQETHWRYYWTDKAKKEWGKLTPDPPPAASPHPEEFCQLCGGPNLLCWFVESPLWNKYVREPGHPVILCPRCFAKLAEDAGYNPTAWQLVPENPPAASPATEGVDAQKRLVRSWLSKTALQQGCLEAMAREAWRFFSEAVPEVELSKYKHDAMIALDGEWTLNNIPDIEDGTANYIGSEIFHDGRWSEGGMLRVRWNNRAMAAVLKSRNAFKAALATARETIARLEKRIDDQEACVKSQQVCIQRREQTIERLKRERATLQAWDVDAVLREVSSSLGGGNDTVFAKCVMIDVMRKAIEKRNSAESELAKLREQQLANKDLPNGSKHSGATATQ